MTTLNVKQIKQKILSTKVSVKEKTRLLFYLKNSDDLNAVNLITYFFELESVLLKHEAAYVLGQTQKKESIAKLIEILESNDDEIVRHEAGEALGNYLDKDCISVCYKHLDDKSIPVRETCYLATKKYEEHFKDTNSKDTNSKDTNTKDTNLEDTNIKNISDFDSFDPAYPYGKMSLDELKSIYLNPDECLYKRYKAMFSLRDMKTKEAVDVLGEGFSDKSDLFKHEIAFVFGQMRMKESVKYLAKTLDDKTQHGMVRHECAEALGAIGSEDAYEALQKHINDDVDVVRESVEVALDIHEYENNSDDEYAVCTA
ncbi:hypothetical protein BDAP_000032 [Binucleata daphniae]